MSEKNRLAELEAAGSLGADLSPGDPLCAWAAQEIKRLRAEVLKLESHIVDVYNAQEAKQIETTACHECGEKPYPMMRHKIGCETGKAEARGVVKSSDQLTMTIDKPPQVC